MLDFADAVADLLELLLDMNEEASEHLAPSSGSVGVEEVGSSGCLCDLKEIVFMKLQKLFFYFFFKLIFVIIIFKVMTDFWGSAVLLYSFSAHFSIIKWGSD